MGATNGASVTGEPQQTGVVPSEDGGGLWWIYVVVAVVLLLAAGAIVFVVWRKKKAADGYEDADGDSVGMAAVPKKESLYGSVASVTAIGTYQVPPEAPDASVGVYSSAPELIAIEKSARDEPVIYDNTML